MRILELRLKNLNSLEGEWRFDFTHPAFIRDGIFAITGPTGSGKTTILDAICLALYGTTPRLGKITKSQNEIMSRRTGECSGELVFETEKGRFRCHWSQHRARKKPGGELQNPKHEISDADTGKILGSGIREVSDLVEEKTGLNFDRFTRSMLLAQGGFAAFLQAGPDERSPLLEEITGTEIYTRISAAVHERTRDEKRELELLKREISGMNLLGTEEKKEIEEKIEANKPEEEKILGEITVLSEALSWKKELDRLAADLLALKEEEEKLVRERDAFAQKRLLLARANLALGLLPEFTGLKSLRTEFGREEGEARELESTLVLLRKALKESETALEKAEEEAREIRETHEKALPELRKARELDVQILEREKPILKLEEETALNRETLALMKEGQERKRKSLFTAAERLEHLETFFRENTADALLVGEFAAIREHFRQADTLVRERALLDEKRKSIVLEIGGYEKELEEGSLALEQSCLVMKEAQKCAEDFAGERDRFLSQEEPGVWHEKRDAFLKKAGILERAQGALQDLDGAKKALEAVHGEREKVLREDSDCSLKIGYGERELALISEREKALERELLLVRKIRSLEEERKLLKEGVPCPLCGSEVHPFAEKEPLTEDGGQKLEETRKAIRDLQDDLTDLRIRHAKSGTILERLEAEEKSLAERVASASALLENIREQHHFFEKNADVDSVAILAEENRKALEETEAFIREAGRLEQECVHLEKSAWEKKEAFLREETLFRDAGHRLDTARENLRRLDEKRRESFLRFEGKMAEVRTRLHPMGVTLSSPEDFGSILENLALRKRNWEKGKEERETLDKEKIILETSLKKEGDAMDRLEGLLRKQAEEGARLRAERDALRTERFALFGERNPDTEEAALKSVLESSEKRLRTAEEDVREKRGAVDASETGLSRLKKAMEKRQHLLSQGESVFRERFEAAGFLHEEDFVSACMDEDERSRLSEEEASLNKAFHSIDIRRREKEDLFARERGRNLTEESGELLQEKLDRARDRERCLQRETGALFSKLSEDARLREEQKILVKNLEARQGELLRWELLDSLVGSHDGKKYRNFVQGLALETVVRHANRYLRTIRDRYILVRNEKEPLDLQVMDTWQANEIRATKNLSGGESFLVSLALALGLSRMSGGNVRMDFLFLDEGFGALDEDALEDALSALSSLRGEGKLVGLISHVPELKQRIPARIELIPERGGRSRVHGPGCS